MTGKRPGGAEALFAAQENKVEAEFELTKCGRVCREFLLCDDQALPSVCVLMAFCGDPVNGWWCARLRGGEIMPIMILLPDKLEVGC